MRGIHRSPANSPHKDQWRGALTVSLICPWIDSWANNGTTGDLRRYYAHCDVIVMETEESIIIISMYSKQPADSGPLFTKRADVLLISDCNYPTAIVKGWHAMSSSNDMKAGQLSISVAFGIFNQCFSWLCRSFADANAACTQEVHAALKYVLLTIARDWGNNIKSLI